MKKPSTAASALVSDDFDRLVVIAALLGRLVDDERIGDAYRICAARHESTLSQVLHERGWLPESDRSALEAMIASRSRDGADRATIIRRLIDQKAPAALEIVRDPDVRRYLQHDDRPVRRTTTRLSLFEVKGEGGLGRVWLARDEVLGRDVAVKQLRAKSGDANDARKRFLREARILARLEHPGVVSIYGLSVGAESDDDFYAMRFVGGRTMEAAIDEYHSQQRMGNESPLALSRLLEQLAQVASTVAYAHNRGIVHRDLKPANVMLGDFGEVVVVDWGLAKILPNGEKDDRAVRDRAATATISAAPIEADSGATIAGDVLGSPLHMAPEQAEGRPESIGPATDVFGLGGILFQILTGEEPHRRIALGKGLRDVIAAVASSGPLRPRALVSRIPKALDEVCAKATANDPKARYDSALEFGQDLQRWIAGESVSAYRESKVRLLRRWLGRHRGLAATAGLISTSVITVGIVIAIAFWQELVVRRAIVAQVLQGRSTMFRHHIRELFVELASTIRTFAAVDRSEAGFERLGVAALHNWSGPCRMAFYSGDENGSLVRRISIIRPRADREDLTISRSPTPAAPATEAMLRRVLASKGPALFVENLGRDQTERRQGYVLRALAPIRRDEATPTAILLDVDLRTMFAKQFTGARALSVAQADAVYICDKNWRVVYNAGSSSDVDHLDQSFPFLGRLRGPLKEPQFQPGGSGIVCVDSFPIPVDKGDDLLWVVVVFDMPPAPWRQARTLATVFAVLAGVALITFMSVAWVRRRKPGR